MILLIALCAALALLLILANCVFWHKKQLSGNGSAGVSLSGTNASITARGRGVCANNNNNNNNSTSNAEYSMLTEPPVQSPTARRSVAQTLNDARGTSIKRELPQIPDWQIPGHRLSSAISEQTSQLYAVVGELVDPSSHQSSAPSASAANVVPSAVSAAADDADEERHSADLAAGYQTLKNISTRVDSGQPASAMSRSPVCRSLNRSDSNDSPDNSTSTDEVTETIPARLAVSGGISASLELPYMTPPTLATTAGTAANSDVQHSNNNNILTAGESSAVARTASPADAALAGVTHAVYFSGDSVQSADSRGYTRITVRQPLSELCLPSTPSSIPPPPSTATASTSARAATAAAVTPVPAGSSSRSPRPSASAGAGSGAAGAPLYADVRSDENNLYSTVDEEVEDNLYEAIVSRRDQRSSVRPTQPAGCFSASMCSLTQPSLLAANGVSSPLIPGNSTNSLSPVRSDRACLPRQHSRQSSNSGVNTRCSTSSISTLAATGANSSTGGVDNNGGRLPQLPPPLSQHQLDLMYARVQRPQTTADAQVQSRAPAIDTSLDSHRSSSSLLATVDDSDSIEPNYERIGAATDTLYCRVGANHHDDDDDDDEDDDDDDEYARIRCRAGSSRQNGSDGQASKSRRSHLYERVRRSVNGVGDQARGVSCQPRQLSADDSIADHLYSRIGEPPYATAYCANAGASCVGVDASRLSIESSKRCTSLPPSDEIDVRVSQLYARVQKRNRVRSSPPPAGVPSPPSSPLPPPLPPPLLDASIESVASASIASEQTVYYL